MSDQLFIVLRVCLLALVYLVFLRVLRAVWVEMRAESGDAPAPTPKKAPSRRPAPQPQPVAAAAAAPAARPSPAAGAPTRQLVLVAPPALAGHTFALDGEVTIGRGAGCAVAIDDAHVSKLHARVYPHDGGWLVEDLGSTNGTELNGDALTGPTAIDRGGRIRIGEIILELA